MRGSVQLNVEEAAIALERRCGLRSAAGDDEGVFAREKSGDGRVADTCGVLKM